MEKSIVHYLLNKIINKFASDLVQIIASCQQSLLVVNGNAVNVFHHKHAGSGVFPIKDRRFHKCNVLVFPGKFLHVGSFGKEIHLLLGNPPQLFQNQIQIHGLLNTHWRQQLHRLFHKTDITGHDLIDALSLNLHHHFFPCFQDGAVHLGDGG